MSAILFTFVSGLGVLSVVGLSYTYKLAKNYSPYSRLVIQSQSSSNTQVYSATPVLIEASPNVSQKTSLSTTTSTLVTQPNKPQPPATQPNKPPPATQPNKPPPPPAQPNKPPPPTNKLADIEGLSEKFVEGVSELFENIITEIKKVKNYQSKEVLGVSFVPIHKYVGGDPALVGKTCVVLGKEKGKQSVAFNYYNFFGGKVVDKVKQNGHISGKVVARILFEEVYEELHIALKPVQFKKAYLEYLFFPYIEWKNGIIAKDGFSLVFLVHVSGLSRSIWNEEHTIRLKSGVPWKYREMSEIIHYPIETLKTYPTDVSAFVKNTVQYLEKYINSLDDRKKVKATEFPHVCVRGNDVSLCKW